MSFIRIKKMRIKSTIFVFFSPHSSSSDKQRYIGSADGSLFYDNGDKNERRFYLSYTHWILNVNYINIPGYLMKMTSLALLGPFVREVAMFDLILR